jgi:hypothetical protein
MERDGSAGFGCNGKPDFWIHANRPLSGPTHIAIASSDQATVQAFHAAGLAAGGHDNGPPGPRPTTTRTTTAPSSWIQTATTLKPSATGRHSAAQPPRHHTTSTQPPSPFKSCADPPRCCRPQREHRQRYLGAVPGRWHRPSPCRRHRSP